MPPLITSKLPEPEIWIQTKIKTQIFFETKMDHIKYIGTSQYAKLKSNEKGLYCNPRFLFATDNFDILIGVEINDINILMKSH